MTDTPLTDDLARGNHVVPTEFAQELERRLMEQCKLLAMSADREEKLRMELQQARDCFSAAMELAERYKTERDAIP